MPDIDISDLDKFLNNKKSVPEVKTITNGLNEGVDNVENLIKISTFYTSVGISGTHQTLYYAQLDESMKLHGGGGIEEEEIEVIYIPLDEAKKFMFDESYQKTTGVSLAFYWFFENMLTKTN